MKKLFISSVLSLGLISLIGCATPKPQPHCDGKTMKCPHNQAGCCQTPKKKQCPLGF
jgi:hypothetical protein